jgi:hypothetical protein
MSYFLMETSMPTEPIRIATAISFDPDVLDTLRALCHSEHRPLAAVVRVLIDAGLQSTTGQEMLARLERKNALQAQTSSLVAERTALQAETVVRRKKGKR